MDSELHLCSSRSISLLSWTFIVSAWLVVVGAGRVVARSVAVTESDACGNDEADVAVSTRVTGLPPHAVITRRRAPRQTEAARLRCRNLKSE